MRPKIGLVLGGGGSRGIAHVGVLQVLVREGIPIDCIVGTSMGGVVGTLFALGYSLDEVTDGMRNAAPANPMLNLKGLSARARQRIVRSLLAEALEGKTFDDLQIPVSLMAVDMVQGREVALSQGALMPAVLATIALPAVFPFVELDGMQLADGGVIDPLATHVAFAQGMDKVIAVDVHPPLNTDEPWTDPVSAFTGFQLPFGRSNASNGPKKPGMLAALWRASCVMAWYLHATRLEAHPPDVLLRPKVESYSTMDFRDISGPLEAGIAEAEAYLPALKALVTSTDKTSPYLLKM
jgi:NTE family protein